MKFRYLFSLAAVATSPVLAGDWSQWCGSDSKNLVSNEKDLEWDISAGKMKPGGKDVDMATTKNCLWVAELGSQAYGTPTVAGGKLLVGTNNESPKNKKYLGDRGVVQCYDAKSGKYLWQLVLPKLGAGKVSDWEFLGICSSPTIVGNKAYVVTNRCEVLCMDMNGLADGNQGYQDESKLYANALAVPPEPPVKLDPDDADVLWVYDMRGELGVFPHNIASSSVLFHDGKVYCTTSNGVDWTHTNLPAPTAPSFCVLDAETGELVAEENSGISSRVLHCSWSSPALANLKSKPTIIFGAGDGFCYGFDPKPKQIEKDGEKFDILPEYWRYYCNPPETKGVKYATPKGPNEVVGTPVVHENLVYVLTGQDPEHGDGQGMLSCIDPASVGDITGSAKWTFKDIGRSISTPAIKDGLLYISDYAGKVYCLDIAKKGELLWKYDTLGRIWSSTVCMDGRILIGTEEAELIILKEGREEKELAKIEFPSPLYASPVAANGILYVTTQTHLYAFGKKP